MRVAIVGSRDYPELGEVRRFVAALAKKYPEATIISGGAKGVDSAAEQAALSVGLDVCSFRPKPGPGGYRIQHLQTVDGHWVHEGWLDKRYWNSFGRAAFARNRNIVECADVVVAFTTGSKGTAHSITLAELTGTPVHIYRPKGA